MAILGPNAGLCKGVFFHREITTLWRLLKCSPPFGALLVSPCLHSLLGWPWQDLKPCNQWTVIESPRKVGTGFPFTHRERCFICLWSSQFEMFLTKACQFLFNVLDMLFTTAVHHSLGFLVCFSPQVALFDLSITNHSSFLSNTFLKRFTAAGGNETSSVETRVLAIIYRTYLHSTQTNSLIHMSITSNLSQFSYNSSTCLDPWAISRISQRLWCHSAYLPPVEYTIWAHLE